MQNTGTTSTIHNSISQTMESAADRTRMSSVHVEDRTEIAAFEMDTENEVGFGRGHRPEGRKGQKGETGSTLTNTRLRKGGWVLCVVGKMK